MRRLGQIALLVLAALGLAFVVERFVVTDREAIFELLGDAAAAVSRDDWEAVGRSIDEAYSARGRDKEALLAWARERWRKSSMRVLILEIVEVTVEGDRATARVVAWPGTRFSGFAYPGRVDLVRRDGDWRIDAVAADDPALER